MNRRLLTTFFGVNMVIRVMSITTSSRINVTIRPMIEKDAPKVAEIWRNGLKQTAESYFVLKPLMEYLLAKYSEDAMKPEGDIGPEGNNLLDIWLSKSDRTMLVACQDNKCIGCIGVKVGEDMNKQEPGSTLGSVWRMSVEESHRRQGVGLMLINAAEDWARQQRCTAMILETTNKIAAKFYTEKAGYREEPFPKERSMILHYTGILKLYTKSLNVEEAKSIDNR